ncbi:hypothetical protein JX266_009262 [Neoarthrinium moseri]|nr:hypothetical protein JX266_009262 [Neoarthrinium moseri]
MAAALKGAAVTHTIVNPSTQAQHGGLARQVTTAATPQEPGTPPPSPPQGSAGRSAIEAKNQEWLSASIISKLVAEGPCRGQNHRPTPLKARDAANRGPGSAPKRTHSPMTTPHAPRRNSDTRGGHSSKHVS